MLTISKISPRVDKSYEVEAGESRQSSGHRVGVVTIGGYSVGVSTIGTEWQTIICLIIGGIQEYFKN